MSTSSRRLHWPEYLLEGLELGTFMLSACLVVALVEHPGSPVRGWLTPAWSRRVVVGAAMGLTAVALIYSPWGKRTGAHMNPAVTLTFLRLGKIGALDALLYVLAQTAGSYLGVLLSAQVLGAAIADPAVSYVVTLPGASGVGVAFLAELGISASMMLVVLASSNHARWSRRTGLLAGLLVALYISLEAPLSGMSMNPARTLGSALVARSFDALWVYLLAPPLGMLLGAELYLLVCARGARRRVPAACAKLQHDRHLPCIFCAHALRRATATHRV
jgi:aquaporin Z